MLRALFSICRALVSLMTTKHGPVGDTRNDQQVLMIEYTHAACLHHRFLVTLTISGCVCDIIVHVVVCDASIIIIPVVTILEERADWLASCDTSRSTSFPSPVR